jgi:two-component system sensor histidine kinase BaeS
MAAFADPQVAVVVPLLPELEPEVQDGVTISVADMGPGIAPDDLPHVFELFWWADKMRSREAGGTGLGLPIARQIAEAHGAELGVENELGRGTTFRIRFRSSAV